MTESSPSPDEWLARALQQLPHGPEFRLLDRLLSLDPGRRGSGLYHVRGDESYLRGHFPGDPLMPGVLLVESAAQLAGVVAQSDPGLGVLPGLKLTAVRGAKILGAVRPGEDFEVEAEITGRLGGLVQARARGRVGGRVVLEVELTLSGGAPAEKV
ncbi:MAG: hypothetical protein RJA22_223 [Verrucomicrobiota bacterium]|jgi:3-hydroxyacyl-[acyl-carrier-protein] dehydratase